MARSLSAFLLLVFMVFTLDSAEAQWTQINGIGGASVTCFASNTEGMFAGTNDGIIFSSDNGLSWSVIDSGLTESNITAMIADDTNLFAGSQSANLNSGVIYRWNRFLKQWQKLSAVPSVNSGIYSFAILGPFVYAITDLTVALSFDDGMTWNFNDTTFSKLGLGALSPVSTELFAGTGNGILSSLDFGASWIRPSSQFLAGNTIQSLATQGNALFAGTNNKYDAVHPDGIYRSMDFGETWTLVYETALINVFSFCVSGSHIYAATDSGVLFSSDSGNNWEPQNTGLTNFKVHTLSMIGTTLFAGTSGDGIFRSSDSGLTWKPGNTGITGVVVSTLFDNGTDLFAGDVSAESYYNGGVARSTDEGISWRSINPDSAIDYVTSFADIDNQLFMGSNEGLNISSNQGMSWLQRNAAFNQDYGMYAFDDLGPNLFAATNGYGIFRSSDSGHSWIPSDSGLPKSSRVFSFATIGNTLFEGSYNGVFRSTDTGETWERMNTGLTDTDIFCLASIGLDLFAGDVNYHGVLRSTDQGASWSEMNSGLPYQAFVYTFAADGTSLFAGTDGGVFLSTDLGNTWAAVSEGLPAGDHLAIDDTYLFATSYSQSNNNTNGIRRRPLSEMIPRSDVAERPALPFAIQIYPNPCSQATTISCNSESSGFATVSIVNVLGIEVAGLFAGELAAGEHSFEWNKSPALPNGIYEVVLSTPASHSEGRLVISR